MTLLEHLGEKIMSYSNRAFYYLLSVLIGLIEGIRTAARVLGRFSPYPILEKRGVELKDYLVLKAQFLALGFLVLAVLYIFGRFIGPALSILMIIVGASAASSVLSLREHFSDYVAYRDFFFSYIGISIVLLIVKRAKPTLDLPFPYAHFVVIALAYMLAFSYFFRSRYSRDHTLGRVIEGGDPMRVKVNYDIAASVKPGVHIFKNDIKAKEGDVVRLAVGRGFLNLRGSRVIAVLELVKE